MRAFFVNRMMRRIITCMLLTEFLWGLGNFFVWPTTTLPAYLTSLGASKLLIGVLSVAISSLVLLPQLFGRVVFERIHGNKRTLVALHLCFTALYLLVPAAHRLLQARPELVILAVLALLTLASLVMGIIIPVWMDMLAQVVPIALRGRYFGVAALFFAGGGVLGGLGVDRLRALMGEHFYQGVFLVAGGFFVLSMTAFSLAPISASVFTHPPESSLWSRLRKSVSAVHPRTDFGRLVLSLAAQTLSAMIIPFLIVYATDAHRGLGYPDTIIGWVIICQALGSAFGGLALGFLVDSFGPRFPWAAATLLVPFTVLLIPHGALWPLLVIAFVVAGVFNTAWSVTGPATLELSPAGDKSGYVAIANVVCFLPGALGALLLGRCIDVYGYAPAFLIAAAAGILACLIALTIRNRAATHAPESPVVETA